MKISRPRGRPRAFEPAVALDTCMRRLWEGGYAATSMEDLAAAVGAAKPALYGAFGPKEAIFAQALRRYGEAEGGAAFRALLGASDLKAGVRGFFATLAGVVGGGRGCMLAASLAECHVLPPAAAQAFRGALEGGAETITSAVERLMAQEPGRWLGTAEETAGLMVDLMHGLAARGRAGALRGNLDRAARRAAEAVLALAHGG